MGSVSGLILPHSPHYTDCFCHSCNLPTSPLLGSRGARACSYLPFPHLLGTCLGVAPSPRTAHLCPSRMDLCRGAGPRGMLATEGAPSSPIGSIASPSGKCPPCCCGASPAPAPGSLAATGAALVYLEAASVFAEPNQLLSSFRLIERGGCLRGVPSGVSRPGGLEEQSTPSLRSPRSCCPSPQTASTRRLPPEASGSPPDVWGRAPQAGSQWVGTECPGLPASAAPPASPCPPVCPSQGGSSWWEH